jgi:hypothetical protein
MNEILVQIDRIVQVAEALRLKSNHDPFADDLEDLATELQDIADILTQEVE